MREAKFVKSFPVACSISIIEVFEPPERDFVTWNEKQEPLGQNGVSGSALLGSA